MAVVSAQSVTGMFTTRQFDTGNRSNAASLPTATLYVNGVSNAATVTVTNVSTGLYKFQVTLPTLSLGDLCSVIAVATVNNASSGSVTDNSLVWQDTREDACVGDLATDYAKDATHGGVNVTQVVGSSTAANNHQGALLAIYSGTVTGSPTTTTFIDTAQAGGDDGWWNGRIILFSGGSLAGQGTPITGWNHTSKTYTFKALTRAPTVSDPYVIV